MRVSSNGWKRARIALLLVAAGTVAGCGAGHGKYTQEFKEQAELRMTQVKAATEYDMARQQFLAGDLKKSLKTIDNSLQLSPDVPKSHVLKARALLESGSLELAMDSLETAIELNPEFAEAHYYAGIIRERWTRPGEAYESYIRAFEIEPTDAQYLLAAGEALIDQGELDKARELLSTESGEFEHNAGIRQTLAHIAQMQGDLQGAVDLFEEAYLLAPDEPGLLEDLSRALIAAGDHADGETHLRRLLAKPGMDERRDLLQLHARTLMNLDRPVEAREILVNLVKDPEGAGDPRLWRELANAAVKLEDGRRLREAANRLIAITPQSHQGHYLLALWHHMHGRTENAVDTLARAVLLSDNDAAPALLQAVLLDRLGDPDGARAALRIASSIAPDDLRIARIEAGLDSAAASTSAFAGVDPEE